MKLLVFSTVIPTKKNLRVKTFETLHKALKKRIPTELIWVVYQPDQFEKIMMDDQTIYCIQDFNDGVDLLKKLNEISIVNFDHTDVVRHPLVTKIVKAYDDFKDD